MGNENAMSRRRLFGVAGAAGLAALAADVLPVQAAAPKYPVLRKSIESMEEAIEALEKGRKIFGGHRVKAIRALKAAIEECRAAIKFAEGNG